MASCVTSSSLDKYNFLTEPPSALVCVICLEVAEDPWQHGDQQCGRLLCEECLEKLGRDKPCPNCRGDNPQYFKDHRGKREILDLKVKCSKEGKGCKWEGTIGTLQGHVETCGFTLVSCPKRCKADNSEVRHFMREDLAQHLDEDCPNRDYECPHKCGEKGTYASITEEHDKTCEKKILPCPNAGCEETVERQQVSQHVEACPHTVLACKYKGIGCATELKREDLAAHEQDNKLHLGISVEAVCKQQEDIRSLQATRDTQKNTISFLQEKVAFLEEEIILFQEESQKIKIYKFLDFRWNKEHALQQVFTNSAFYTHPRGYHITLGVCANGDGAGESTHVSVFACILEGKYDAELKWPFVGKFTFTLLNQLEDKNHYTRSLSVTAAENACVNEDGGLSTFAPHSCLAYDPIKNTQYLKDNTLYFKLGVKVTGHKPWLQ